MGTRQHMRYELSHSTLFGGSISEGGSHFRLASLSRGGCGFISTELDPDFAPPKEIVCSIYSTNSKGFAESEVLMGNLIYLRPKSSTAGASYIYGVKFFKEHQSKLDSMLSKLGQLFAKGVIDEA